MRGKHEWTLWVVAGSAAAHAAEELLTGWLTWAPAALGISVPASYFVVANAVLVTVAVVTARLGWRRPTAALIVPAATLANGVLFHILPTLATSDPVPGVYSATLLYLPFSTLALVGARRDGVDQRAVGLAAVIGMAVALGVVLLGRAVSVR